MREPNLFEEKEIAEQWIHSIENSDGKNRSRELAIYPFLHSWSQQFKNSTIVEIGSGQGVCSSKVDLSTSTYIGVEPAPVLLERARKLYPEKNKHFVKGDSYSIPLEDDSVDAVFSVGVWFHVEYLDHAHKEIARVMKSGAKLLIVTANPDVQSTWESFFEHPKISGKRIEGKIKVPNGFMTNNILYIHSKQELIDSLERNGFGQIKIDEFWIKPGQDRGIFISVEATKI